MNSKLSLINQRLEQIKIRYYDPPYRTLNELHEIAKDLECNDIVKKIEQLDNNYYYKLCYLAKNPGNRSEADMVYMWSDIESIYNKLRHEIRARDTDTLYGTQHRYQALRPEENLQSLISDYLSESERLRTDVTALTDSRSHARLEQLAGDIFNRLWTAFDIDEDVPLLLDILNDETVDLTSRLLWLNALGLRATQGELFERDIFESMARSADRRLSIAAQVWSFIVHFSREINLYSDDNYRTIDPMEIVRTIIDIFCSAPGTDLMADMSRLSSRFQGINLSDAEALKNLNLSAEDYESISRFQEAQARGADVLGLTVGRMRHFPFFSRLENWFMPFDAGHSAMAEITNGEGAEVVEQIAAIPNVTDSDKYAMVLSMSEMPSSMRARSLSAMVDSIRTMTDTPEYREAMKELGNVPDKVLMSATLQGLARFVRSYTRVGEFALGRILSPAAILDTIINIEWMLPLTADDKERFADGLISLNHNVDKAKMLYEEVYIEKPDSETVALKLAKLSDSAGKIIELLEPFRDGNNREVLELLSKAYGDKLRYDEALAIFQRLDYQAEGKDYWVLNRLAALYLSAKRFDDAHEVLMRIPREERNSTIPFFEVITTWLTGDSDFALTLVDELYESEHQADIEVFVAPLQKSIDRLICWDNDSVLLLPDIVRYRYLKDRY